MFDSYINKQILIWGGLRWIKKGILILLKIHSGDGNWLVSMFCLRQMMGWLHNKDKVEELPAASVICIIFQAALLKSQVTHFLTVKHHSFLRKSWKCTMEETAMLSLSSYGNAVWTSSHYTCEVFRAKDGKGKEGVEEGNLRQHIRGASNAVWPSQQA